MHKVQVTLPYLSGIPEDVVSNTFYARKRVAGMLDPDDTEWIPGIQEGSLADLKTEITQFYYDVFGAPGADGYLAPYIDKANCRIKIYDMDDEPTRVPHLDETFSFTATPSITNKLPAEVAMAVSFSANVASGESAASKRGRIFLGGLGDGTVQDGGSVAPRFKTVFCTRVAAACELLQTNMYENGWHWVVYSPKLGTNSRIHRGWVDNAFDTQRRRGVNATARSAWHD